MKLLQMTIFLVGISVGILLVQYKITGHIELLKPISHFCDKSGN